MTRVEVVAARRSVTRLPSGITRRGAFSVTFLTRASTMSTISVISPYLLDRGVPVADLGFVMVGSALGSGGSALYAGRLIDRIGGWRVLVGGLLVAIVSVLGVIYAPDWPRMAVCYFCSAAGASAAGTSLRTAIGLTTPEKDQEKVFGKLNSVATTGAVIGPLLVGVVVVDGIKAAPWFAVTALSLALLASLFARQPGTVRPEDAAPDGAAGEATAPGDAKAADELPSMLQVVHAILPISALITTTATMYGIYATLWGVYLHRLGASNPVIAWSTSLIGTADATALAGRRPASMADPRLRAVVQWAVTCRTAAAAAGHRPACPPDQAPELIGTTLLLHYLNRMVNVFLGEVPLPPACRTWRCGPSWA